MQSIVLGPMLTTLVQLPRPLQGTLTLEAICRMVLYLTITHTVFYLISFVGPYLKGG